MPRCLEARAPMGGRLTGTAWVRGALQRLIGEMPDLRKGLRTPEEVSAEEALPIINRLTQTFRKQVDPRTRRTSFVVQPPTLVMDGGATGLVKSGGALTALYDRTRRTVEEALTAIGRIAPLDPNADPIEVRSTQAIIRSNLEALVAEVQQEPRGFQMDSLFRSLLDDPVDPDENARGYIGRLQQIAGLASSNIRQMGDYEHYTRFLLIRDSIQCLRASWISWKTGATAGDLGMQFVRVTWLFQAVRETVGCYRRELDEICIGDATRWTLPVAFPTTPTSDHEVEALGLESFLDIVDSEATRWDRLLTDGGTIAVPAIRGFVHNINDLVKRATGELATYPEAVVPETPRRTDRRPAPAKHEPAAAPPSPSEYEIFKADRLRAAFDVAQRLGTLLQEIEDELTPVDDNHNPPVSEQRAL